MGRYFHLAANEREKKRPQISANGINKRRKPKKRRSFLLFFFSERVDGVVPFSCVPAFLRGKKGSPQAFFSWVPGFLGSLEEKGA
jgi:hypothetical protein